MKLIDLNYEELLVGYLYGMVTWFVIGLWSLLLAVVTAYFWALTGAGESKLYRRLINPLIVSGVFAAIRESLVPLASIPLQFAVLSLGYGVTSTQPYDPGSWLGRIFGKWTRLVWFLLLGLSMMPLALN